MATNRRKKNSAKKIIIFIVGLPAIAIAVYYIFNFLKPPKFIHYNGFGIDMPVDYAIHGIDRKSVV